MDGLDIDLLTRWVANNVHELQPPLELSLIAGGRSNLTFEIRDNLGNRGVLRRPPISHVLPTAHDMEREFRIISALSPTDVPVPKPLALCTDRKVAELPFYVMSYVEGEILKNYEEVERTRTPESRGAISKSLISVLAKLHDIEPDAVGLGDLGRKGDYLKRQLKRWHGQYTKSSQEIDSYVPLIDEVHAKLSARVPDQLGTAIVHGDYRLDNTMVSPEDSIAAVLDWEICTLGDPLADLGLLMVYWAQPEDQEAPLGTVTTLEGFYTREELALEYQNQSQRDVSNIGYYLAFGYWKLACILQGVNSRYLQGATAGDTTDVDKFDSQVNWLAQSAHDALREL